MLSGMTLYEDLLYLLHFPHYRTKPVTLFYSQQRLGIPQKNEAHLKAMCAQRSLEILSTDRWLKCLWELDQEQ